MSLLRVFADAEALSRAAAREFVELGGEALGARGRFTVALAGGSTPRRVYELLAELEQRDRVDWARVELFWGDERAVPPDHPDSNYGMASAALLWKLDVPAEPIHRMPAERPDRSAAARDYQLEIARVLGVRARREITVPGHRAGYSMILPTPGGGTKCDLVHLFLRGP